MPLYEYACGECGDRSEALQRMDDAPLTTCSKCGGPLKKLLSAPAFQFKGTGWYVTDYARKGEGDADKTSGSSDEGGSKTASDSSESKSDSKPKSDGDSKSKSDAASTSKEKSA